MWRFSLALFAAASAVTAQPTVNPNVAGYGRISCTNYDGSPNYAFCTANGHASCVFEVRSGNYFCGIIGSECSGNNCDGDSLCLYGHCNGGDYGWGGICAGSLQTSPYDYTCGGIDAGGGAGESFLSVFVPERALT
ncbi:hypothetical protein BMF94_6298, partial [Rhodotorula taiwanensis]